VIVIGIDPAKYGFHAAMVEVMDDGEEVLALRSFSAEQKAFQLPSTVLAKIHAAVVESLFAIHSAKPDVDIAVFCEEAVSVRNLRTYGQLAMAVGAIMAATTLYTRKCYLVPVSKWKQVTIGSGTASKDQVALWLNRVHPAYAARCGASQDLVDACCITRYGLTVLADSLLVGAVDGPGEI
jgi:Holliday junction resolvasome RuvABC endonuclease subunit